MSRVLVAVDRSDPAEAAVSFALEQFPDADIHAVYVLENLANYAADPSCSDPQRRAQEEVDDLFEHVRSIASDHGRNVTTDTVEGHPARAIVNYADENGFDQIVVGSHGRTGPARILLGSVAETIVRRAGCPVTVVR